MDDPVSPGRRIAAARVTLAGRHWPRTGPRGVDIVMAIDVIEPVPGTGRSFQAHCRATRRMGASWPHQIVRFTAPSPPRSPHGAHEGTNTPGAIVWRDPPQPFPAHLPHARPSKYRANLCVSLCGREESPLVQPCLALPRTRQATAIIAGDLLERKYCCLLAQALCYVWSALLYLMLRRDARGAAPSRRGGASDLLTSLHI